MAGRPSATAGRPIPVPSAAPEVAAAYDAIAPRYDEMVREDAWMRALLRRRVEHLAAPGKRLLELGCGTGIDTLALARRGLRVSALDVSPAMLARLVDKARETGLEALVEGIVGDVEALGELGLEGPFDAAFSAFAVLNTVVDPAAVAAAVAALLRPGGGLLVHVLAPAGARSVSGTAKAEGATSRAGEYTASICGRPIRHWVLPSDELYDAFFAPHFHLRRRYALGFLWPRRAGAVLPAPVARNLARLEPLLGARTPFLGRGRFAVLELVKRGAKGRA